MAGQDPQCTVAVEDSQAEADSVVDNLQCTVVGAEDNLVAVLADNLAEVMAEEVDFQDNSVVEVVDTAVEAFLVDNLVVCNPLCTEIIHLAADSVEAEVDLVDSQDTAEACNNLCMAAEAEVASEDSVDNNLCTVEDSKAVIIISTNNKIHTDSL